MKRRRYIYLCLTIPAILLIILFIAVPLFNAISLSFLKWNGYSQNRKWIGFENYIQAFSDRLFWRTLINTLIYGFGSCLLQNLGGLFVAIFLNNKFRGRNGVRVVVYMPIMISAFIMGQILYYFFQYDGGVFNEILKLFGLPAVYWMEKGWTAVSLITLVNSWQYIGLCMIIYLAGLQNIPNMYREAARLDGANKIYEFAHVTLPLLIPAITTAVVTNLIGGFKMFDVIVAMSGGGPSKQSMSLSYYISTLYFTDERAGYSSAIGVILFAVIIIITLPVNAWLRKKEVEY
ncbi:raffinose/stachyose/melibiose transport system permease protein [Anaerocolumna jejuensis DSM 15929]|uniref:Raffinose/stachyose/melibiose transport system permease protein n=1 Tax=Anaerocolumna jejuensis DSM 15929 TaxID=1121322 RepID=A0A1M7BP10_9FIRM|nr:raffinose/stachyose/melibiose transport system permease protein [Anaerocolumna jejuensis DSM 15929]